MRTIHAGAAALAVALALTGCAGGMGEQTAIEDVASFHSAPRIEVVRPGQSLRLVVFGSSDLSGTYRVSEHGVLRLPGQENIDVSGMSVRELEQLIAARLAAAGRENPQVSIMIE